MSLSTKKKKPQGGFHSLGLSRPVLKGVLKKGYRAPTPIQRRCIPVAMKGGDVVAMARTGSGKTAAFLVPMFERLKEHSTKIGARAVVLSPTRELALQTHKFARQLGKMTTLRACILVGGESMDQQFNALCNNPDIIIATPGRLAHILEQADLSLRAVEYFVCDEADRLFEMGFAEQLRSIMAKMGPDRQVLLFSATMPKQLVEFSRAGLKDPAVVRLDSDSKMSDKLEMVFFTVRSDEKIGALLYILREIVPDGEQTLVFAPTRYVAELLCRILEHIGTRVSMIFGSLDQVARVANLGRFRNKNVDVLVVTDLASRGLDIPLLDNVICFGLPDRPRGFVHRVGRVARAGRTGRAYALVEPTELAYLVDLSVFLGRPLHTVPEDGGEIDKEKMYYGTIPRSLLDNEVPFVKNLLKAQDDLANLLNVSKKAEILYNKTRSGASPASVRRVKRLHPEKIHPMLAHLYKKEERALDECVNVLKSYRPSSTIFELGTNRTKAGFMRAKRREHQQSIVEKQERAERIKKRKRQEAVEMIDSSDSEVDISDSGGESELEHIDAVDTTDVVSVSVIPTEGSSGSSKQKRTLAYKDPSGMEPTQKFRDQKFYVSSEPENKFADSLTNFTSDRQPRVDEVAFEVNP
eukprot:730756_1